jgi:hypothetical protein
MSERLVDQLRLLVEADARWQLVNARPLAVDFIAREWTTLMPVCGTRDGYRRAHWLTLSFRCDEGFRAVRFEAALWEFEDDSLRQRVLASLQSILSPGRSVRYAKGFKVMQRDDVKILNEDDLADPAGIVSDVRRKLDQLGTLIAPIKASLESLFGSK